jgi:chemotaxis protein CheD
MTTAIAFDVPIPQTRLLVESYLHPGELAASVQPQRITTILGSCVSVCLFDTRHGVAGLNHFLLPHAPASAASSTRYGDVAIDVLVRQLLKLGAKRDSIIAKLFGGANVLRAFADDAHHIGVANVELARHALARHDIPVGAEDVGGIRGRKLVFSMPDGAAWVRVIGQ